MNCYNSTLIRQPSTASPGGCWLVTQKANQGQPQGPLPPEAREGFLAGCVLKKEGGDVMLWGVGDGKTTDPVSVAEGGAPSGPGAVLGFAFPC